MGASGRWLWPHGLASLLWASSFALNAAPASLLLRDAGHNDTVIGLNTAIYYLGIAVAAGFVPTLLARLGSRCLLLGMILSAASAAAFPWGGSLLGWFALRGLNGLAGALSLIPLEAYVNHRAPPERRAFAFGCYAVCIAVGMAVGTVVGLQLYTLAPAAAFVLSGIAASLGAITIVTWRPDFSTIHESKTGRTPLYFRRNFLGFGAAWGQGFLEGGMVALLPIYLLGSGLAEETVGWLMGGLMLGVIAAQVPLAWLADRHCRTTVLVACHLVTLLGIVCLLVPVSTLWLATWLFAVGACSGAFYPLGLALVGSRTPKPALARANAWYLGINCAGSLCGPIAAGVAMDSFGRTALFWAGGIAVAGVVAIWCVMESRTRKASECNEETRKIAA